MREHPDKTGIDLVVILEAGVKGKASSSNALPRVRYHVIRVQVKGG